VEGGCASACTIAFLAGKERAADPGSKIGFHASRGVGSTEAKPTPAETERLRGIYRTAGLPEAFIAQALDTPSATMWYPSTDQMLAARVLTRRSMGGETAALSTMMRTRESLAAEFKKTDVFAAIAERSPQEFDGMVDAAWKKIQAGATDVEVTTAARMQLSAMIPRYLPLASEETLVAYQKLMQQELEVLRDKDPTMCVELVFPSGKPVNFAGYLSKDLAAKDLQMTTQIMREADPARAVKPSKQAVERIAMQAAKHMTSQQITVFSEDTARMGQPARVVCDAAIAFIGGLNAIPAKERGKALRILYSSG
jgi:creatinine amidohydrolase/Fe(II)-dependent formamide hydrolase-like protein